jgi:hypothetical protein
MMRRRAWLISFCHGSMTSYYSYAHLSPATVAHWEFSRTNGSKKPRTCVWRHFSHLNPASDPQEPPRRPYHTSIYIYWPYGLYKQCNYHLMATYLPRVLFIGSYCDLRFLSPSYALSLGYRMRVVIFRKIGYLILLVRIPSWSTQWYGWSSIL